jgi:hypothetical protein
MAFDRCAASEVFAPELARLDKLLEAQIRRLRARYELSLDEFRGLYVSDEQVDELVRSSGKWRIDSAAVPPIPDEAGAICSPWEHLRTSLGLSATERDLLLLCLAPELDPKYETLFAYLNNDVTRKWPTPELAGRIFAAEAGGRSALRATTQADARLMRVAIIETVPSARDLPRGQRGLRIAPAVADWLLGLPYCDDVLQSLVRLLPVQDAPTAHGLDSEQADRAAELIAADEPSNFVCIASSIDEAMAEAHRLFACAGRDALLFDLASLRLGTPELTIALERMATILGLGVILAPLDALHDPEGRAHDTALGLARRFARRGLQIVWVGTRESRWRDVFIGNEGTACQVIECPEPETAERAHIWHSVLGERARGVDVNVLADRFIFGPAGIGRVVRHAERQARFGGSSELSQQQLLESARSVSSESLGGATRRVATRFDWSQLILPHPVKQRLRDIVSAIESRPLVLDEWGFAGKLGNARGVKVMFAGPSGTGKTMAAAIIARTLSLDLQRIELAGVISKYIGETEKNLDRAFEAARRTNSILFIDEADALFGKRSEVKDAHDRYANVETAYLLQKMEDHGGVVVIATNLPGNMDEAFSRRMHFVLDFPMPDAASRELLWRGMLPAQAPVDGDVDLPFLAKQFVFAGGDIRNVVLDAAYLAAQEGGPIAMRHFLAAVARQLAKRGRLPTTAEFKEYFGMLAEGGHPRARAEPRETAC